MTYKLNLKKFAGRPKVNKLGFKHNLFCALNKSSSITTSKLLIERIPPIETRQGLKNQFQVWEKQNLIALSEIGKRGQKLYRLTERGILETLTNCPTWLLVNKYGNLFYNYRTSAFFQSFVYPCIGVETVLKLESSNILSIIYDHLRNCSTKVKSVLNQIPQPNTKSTSQNKLTQTERLSKFLKEAQDNYRIRLVTRKGKPLAIKSTHDGFEYRIEDLLNDVNAVIEKNGNIVNSSLNLSQDIDFPLIFKLIIKYDPDDKGYKLLSADRNFTSGLSQISLEFDQRCQGLQGRKWL